MKIILLIAALFAFFKMLARVFPKHISSRFATRITLFLTAIFSVYILAIFTEHNEADHLRSSLAAKLSSALPIGGSAENVRATMNRNGVPSNYNESLKRYSAIIPVGTLTNCGVLIYIYVDSKNKIEEIIVVSYRN